MKKKLNEKVLAYGEVTGHAHRVDVDVFEQENGVKEFSGKTKITHEEHKEIELPENEWVSDRVVEYDYFKEMQRRVSD